MTASPVHPPTATRSPAAWREPACPPETVPRWRIVLLRALVNALFAIFTRREVSGLDNLPTEGGAVLVFNHLSNFDTPLFFSLIRRPKLTALIADDKARPLYRFLIEAPGGMWIKRGASDRAALERAITALDDGWIVGFAPEGRRSPTKALIEGKPGPAFLAARAGVPVLPVGLTGTEHLARSLKRLRRTTVTVRFGEPFRLPPLAPRNMKQQLRASTETIMCRVAALVPPEYRGVYADHPQLRALLQDQEPAPR